jgi:porin
MIRELAGRRRADKVRRIAVLAAACHSTLIVTSALARQQAEPPPVPPQPTPEVSPTDPPAEPPPAPPAVDPSETIPPTDPFPPTTVEEELAEMRPGTAIKRELDKIAKEINVRFGFANTLLFQQASGGPGMRSAGGGDLDLLAKWTAVGAGTKDTGILAFAAEYRYQVGDQAPAALGGQIGTLTPTTNGFGERPMVVKEMYWDQRLFEDRFRFGIGRIDPENLFGGHRLQSASLYFLNKVFSGNTSVAYPGPGAAAAVQIKPVPWLYIDGGITDANGKATMGNLEGFFEDGEFLTFGEVGLTPTFEGVGTGRYRLALWHIDAREEADVPSDQGITLSMDQDIGDTFTVFLRYGYADGDVTAITNSVQGGVGIRDVLGKENMLGIAAAWSRPKDDSKRDEKVLEIFQRFQITETSQFTVGAEVIFDPSNAPGDDVLGVFSARLRIPF